MNTRKNRNILFIDDDEQTLLWLNAIFTPYYECHYALTGLAGIDLFKMIRPSLTVCDVGLPDLSGIDVCKQLKTLNHSACIALLSAYNDKETRILGLESHADTYIDKALSEKEIFLRIRNLHPLFNQPLDLSETVIAPADLKDQVLRALLIWYSDPVNSRQAASLERISEAITLSSRTLQRRLELEAGTNFTLVHQEFRLNWAKKLLQQGYAAHDISTKLSFSTPSHFSTSFKAYFGVTPSKYKLQHTLH